MKFFLLRMLGSVIVGLLVLMLLIILPPSFTTFEYITPEKQLLPLTEDGNAALSRVLWIDRQLDVMALALLLFVTGICSATLLRTDQGVAS
jgi:hypothetical protein